MGYFEEQRNAAFFKHAIQKRYFPTFVTKVGKYSPGHRVAYLDGYAGPGTYEDGSLGSPALALETAKQLAGVRNLQCFFVERDASQHQKLTALIENSGLTDRVTARHAAVAAEIDYLLGEVGEAPLFAFLDPFGLGIPFTDLTKKLLGRSKGTRRRGDPITEVLVNFVHAGVCRNAGKLTIQSRNAAQIASAEKIVHLVDDNLGGTWWQPLWRAPGSKPSKVAAIREGFVERVLAASGPAWRCYSVAISRTWKGKPIYDLLLFTQHLEGLWFFNEAVSLARGDLKDHCQAGDSEPPQLWDPEDDWRDAIADNLKTLLGKGRPVLVMQAYESVYGSTLGYARATHVRKAIKLLHDRGITPTDGKGEIHQMTVLPARRTDPRSGVSRTA